MGLKTPTIGLMTIPYYVEINGSLDHTMRTINLVVKHVPDSGGGIMTHYLDNKEKKGISSKTQFNAKCDVPSQLQINNKFNRHAFRMRRSFK